MLRTVIGSTLLLFALLQLGYRGMQRYRHDIPLWDFANPYSATVAWLDGKNPYDMAAAQAAWKASGIFEDRDSSYFATVYPPTSLVTLVPFSLLSGGPSLIIFLVFLLTLLALQFAALADIAGIKWRDPRMLLFVGGALATGPMQFGILSAQVTMPAVSLGIFAIWCAAKDRDTLAGILIGLSCAMKPQIGGPFFLYYLFLRRWRLSIAAMVSGGAIGVIALVAMHLSHVDWWTGWKESIARTTVTGGVNDYGPAGTYRDEIMDMKMLLVGLVSNPAVVKGLIYGTFLALFAWYASIFPRSINSEGRRGRNELLVLGTLGALSFLPVYHRVYDAVFLTTVFAWALAELDGPRRKYAIAMLIPMALFLIPFDAMKSFGSKIGPVGKLSKTWFWFAIGAAHYAWGLFLLTIVLLVTMRHIRTSEKLPADVTAG